MLWDFIEEPEKVDEVKKDIEQIKAEVYEKVVEVPNLVEEDTSWYAPLRQVESKGSQTTVVGGLAGLHEARRVHEGQFFTPDSIAKFMWSIVKMEDDNYRKLRILDNSFGSGRLFQFADPEKHQLFGIEKDQELAAAVQEVVQGAGFETQLMTGSMEEFRLSGRLDIGLINPPFSIHLDSPHVESYECNAFGKHGAKSAAFSHKYAVAQALEWCRAVVAVVPRTFAEEAKADEFFNSRLRAVYHLPKTAFRQEGAEVETSVLAWGDEEGEVIEEQLTGFEPRNRPEITIGTMWGEATINRVDEESGEAVINLPVTGDKRVRVVHDGRNLHLKFACGAVQGRVMNKVLTDKVRSYRSKRDGRVPEGVKFQGEGKLDLECHLASGNPSQSFETFLDEIRAVGGEPDVDPAIERLLTKKQRQLEIQRTPFRHVANVSDGGLSRWIAERNELKGVAKKKFPIWGGSGRYYGEDNDVPVGDEIALKRGEYDGKWQFTHKQRGSSMTTEELLDRFDFPDFKPSPNDWTVIHEGLKEKFPEQFAQMEEKAKRLGLDQWCSWSYQFHDLVEIGMKRGNTVIGWEMGLGKMRLSLALCKLGEGQHNLITVEAHLVREAVREIEQLGIPKDEWQIIERPGQLQKLKRYNIIAYSRLKMAVDKRRPKVTFAKKLRRRIHTMVADEAHLLRNLKTDQTRAVFAVSPKVRYAMTGTPIANYPRDVLPLIQWVAGDGTASQEYGLHHPYMTETNVKDMSEAKRGVDVFKDLFVTLEWVTNEFAEDLRTGAKREIPKIKDVDEFRSLVAPVIKRRVMEEPEVAAHINIPRPKHFTREIPWDVAHAAYYVKAARTFVDWFKNLKEYEKRSVGLIAILAKMQAVYTAANFPQEGVADLPGYGKQTSKQRYAVDRLAQLTEEGHKTIFLAHSPAVVEYMAAQLGKLGVDNVQFHGGITVANRIKALDDQFRFGNTPVLLATKGVLQTGYNIHQADRVLFYDRSWTPKVEQQAAARVLRPQQKKQVEIEYLHLEGSIDSYQAQMVEFKAESMKAGLDYGDEDESRDFVHIETILGKFVEDFETKIGQKFDHLISQHL